MRRGYGKLSNFGWLMILVAGVFQIITLVLDQAVIQMEEKNRMNYYNLTKNNELRLGYSEIARRADDINLSHSNILWINDPASFKREKKENILFQILFDQSSLMDDMFRDDDIKKDFKDKKIKLRYTDNSGKFEERDYKRHFDGLIRMSLYIANKTDENRKYKSEFWHQPSGKIRMENGKKITTVEVLRRFIGENSWFINKFVVDLMETIDQIEIKIDKINKEIYKISQEKQILLLFGFVAQLLSIFCLIILFRSFLKK